MRLALGAAAAALLVPASQAMPTTRVPSATCEGAIEIVDEPAPPPDTLVLGRVEMPRADEVLPLGQPRYRGAARFAKRGLSVTAGSPVVLVVPRRYRRVYGIAAGRGRLGAPALRLQPCAADVKPWTTWAGGYLAWKPVCVWLLVRADGRTARVPLNIGRRCTRTAG